MRVLTSLLLALLLAVTSVTFAAARVQEAGTTQMVICAQGAALLVTLDAAGNPVQMAHHCPDCLASLPPAPGPTAFAERLNAPRLVILSPACAQSLPTAALRVARARGPPRSV